MKRCPECNGYGRLPRPDREYEACKLCDGKKTIDGDKEAWNARGVKLRIERLKMDLTVTDVATSNSISRDAILAPSL